jgi:hypothetical protein
VAEVSIAQALSPSFQSTYIASTASALELTVDNVKITSVIEIARRRLTTDAMGIIFNPISYWQHYIIRY